MDARKPTGDPTMPPEVRRAKLIQNKIVERMESSNCESLDLEELGVTTTDEENKKQT